MTTKTQQVKKLLKLPKEAPSNIVCHNYQTSFRSSNRTTKSKKSTSDSRWSGWRKTYRATRELKLNSKNCPSSKVSVPTVFKIGLDSDSKKWQILYLAKIKACQNQIADFTDPKKDAELKEDKKECLIELIDVLDESDAATTILVEKVLTDAF